jgi:hypothetical protein
MLRIIFGTSVMVLLVAGFPTGRECSAGPVAAQEKDDQIYVPKDLDDCFARLKKILKPEDVEKIKRGTEQDMIDYHFGLGLWIRNNWGLWKGGRLAKWFNEQGIHHPDDMSGIVLHSFWRHLNSKPIELDKQVKYYQDYWKQVRVDNEREKARVKRAVVKIRGMMMGISLTATSLPTLAIPNRNGDGIRARLLARFGNNVLLAVRKGPCEDFTAPGYYLDLDENKIHPVTIPEIEDQLCAVVAGGVAYFSGVTKGVTVLAAVNGKARTLIALPETKCAPQLGIDGGNLLAVYRRSVYRLQGTKWSELYKGGIDLPKSGPPPRRFGHRIFFRDEGRGECDKRLWWLELGMRPRLVSLDDDVGVVGLEGPRWENTSSYCVTPAGDLWATAGSFVSAESLVKRSASGKYEVAVINSRLRFDGELLGSASSTAELPVSAVASGVKGDLLLAGDRGIYTLNGNRLQQVVAFGNVCRGPSEPNLPWHGCPSDILQLDENRYLVSGLFEGVYLIQRTVSHEWIAVSLDETIGKPVTF